MRVRQACVAFASVVAACSSAHAETTVIYECKAEGGDQSGLLSRTFKFSPSPKDYGATRWQFWNPYPPGWLETCQTERRCSAYPTSAWLTREFPDGLKLEYRLDRASGKQTLRATQGGQEMIQRGQCTVKPANE